MNADQSDSRSVQELKIQLVRMKREHELEKNKLLEVTERRCSPSRRSSSG